MSRVCTLSFRSHQWLFKQQLDGKILDGNIYKFYIVPAMIVVNFCWWTRSSSGHPSVSFVLLGPYLAYCQKQKEACDSCIKEKSIHQGISQKLQYHLSINLRVFSVTMYRISDKRIFMSNSFVAFVEPCKIIFGQCTKIDTTRNWPEAQVS